MNKIIDRYLFIISILLILPNIQVFSQNQSLYCFLINKKEQQAIIALLTLVNEELPAGEYEVEFNTSTINHNPSSGIYFYQLQTGSFIETKKMILIK